MMCFLLLAPFTLATSSSGMLVRTCSSISATIGKAAASALAELFFSFNLSFSFCVFLLFFLLSGYFFQILGTRRRIFWYGSLKANLGLFGKDSFNSKTIVSPFRRYIFGMKFSFCQHVMHGNLR